MHLLKTILVFCVIISLVSSMPQPFLPDFSTIFEIPQKFLSIFGKGSPSIAGAGTGKFF